MPSPITVEPAELDEGRAIRTAFSDLTAHVGRIEFAKRTLEQARQKADDQYDTLQQRETAFINALIQKYGKGSLNITTGEFTPDTEQ